MTEIDILIILLVIAFIAMFVCFDYKINELNGKIYDIQEKLNEKD